MCLTGNSTMITKWRMGAPMAPTLPRDRGVSHRMPLAVRIQDSVVKEPAHAGVRISCQRWSGGPNPDLDSPQIAVTAVLLQTVCFTECGFAGKVFTSPLSVSASVCHCACVYMCCCVPY